MKFDLQYIRTSELEDYVNSEEYNRQNFVAISRNRAISHANNPRADKDDIALILAYDKNKFIGYLGIIPEYLFKGEQKVKVCWLSCMWVLPEYRRTGIATHLLSDAHKLYNGLVFITNYIPRSKAAFFKTGLYSEIAELPGIRAYFRFDLSTILPRRFPKLKMIKPLLWLADTSLNTLLSIYFNAKAWRIKLENSYEYLEEVDTDTGKFLDESVKENPFRRSHEEFNWMQKYPWISNEKDRSLPYDKYYFSQYAPDFRQWFVRIRNKKQQIVGFLMLTNQKHELKTPYIIVTKEILPDVFQFIYRLMIKEKVFTLVSHHKYFVEQVYKNKNKFLMIRAKNYGFIATNEIAQLMNNKYGKLSDGDGDRAFT